LRDLSPSHFATDSQTVSQSVSASAPFGTRDQILICCQTITDLVVMGRSDWKTGLSVTIRPVFVRCHYKNKAVYSMYNLQYLQYLQYVQGSCQRVHGAVKWAYM